MAAFAAGRGVGVEVATFEDWDPAARLFDVLTAGMTWHWVDAEAGAEQAARVRGPAVGSRCSGTPSRSRRNSPRPSRRSTPNSCRSTRCTSTASGRQRGRRTAPGRHRRPAARGRVRAGRALARRVEAHLHPRRMAGPVPHLRRPRAAAAHDRGRAAGGDRSRGGRGRRGVRGRIRDGDGRRAPRSARVTESGHLSQTGPDRADRADRAEPQRPPSAASPAARISASGAGACPVISSTCSTAWCISRSSPPSTAPPCSAHAAASGVGQGS